LLSLLLGALKEVNVEFFDLLFVFSKLLWRKKWTSWQAELHVLLVQRQWIAANASQAVDVRSDVT